MTVFGAPGRYVQGTGALAALSGAEVVDVGGECSPGEIDRG